MKFRYFPSFFLGKKDAKKYIFNEIRLIIFKKILQIMENASSFKSNTQYFRSYLFYSNKIYLTNSFISLMKLLSTYRNRFRS